MIEDGHCKLEVVRQGFFREKFGTVDCCWVVRMGWIELAVGSNLMVFLRAYFPCFFLYETARKQID